MRPSHRRVRACSTHAANETAGRWWHSSTTTSPYRSNSVGVVAAGEALEHRDVDHAGRLVLAAADLADLRWVEVEVLGEPGAPLVDELLAVDEHERRCAVVRDHGAGHDRLAGSGRGDEDAAVVGREVRDGGGLLGSERRPTNSDLDRLGVGAVGRRGRAGCRARSSSSATCSVSPRGRWSHSRSSRVAGDEPWRVPGREPHPLLLVELGVVRSTRGASARRAPPAAGPIVRSTTSPASSGPDHRRGRRPALAGQLGEAERRPGVDRPERSPRAPTTASGARRATDDRNAHWSGHGSSVVGSRNSVLPRASARPEAAERSGSRTLPSAGSPGRGRTGRSSTGPARRARSWPGAAAPHRATVPSTRGRAPSKKTQTWPPSPERERSSAAGTPCAWHASR